MKRTKIVNLYGGPGTGKSTTAAALFAEMKIRGVNCEYIQEYAKDKAWEFGKIEGAVVRKTEKTVVVILAGSI